MFFSLFWFSRINRIRLEFKVIDMVSVDVAACRVLIESDWNLKWPRKPALMSTF